MPSASKILAVAASISQASAVFQGFNYGATFTNGAIKQQSDYEDEFRAAKALPGTNGAFNSARIYTCVQGDTPDMPIAAIPAALATKTNLLLGLWASAGDAAFNNEISALQQAITQYCSQGFGPLVAGISVGSEDLYRISPIGIQAGSDPGVGPDVIVGYMNKVRNTIKGTCLSGAPVGHVDTWTAYVNSSNNAVIEASDWLGMDAYPYFESTHPNDISQGKVLLDQAMDNTAGAAMGKPIWLTETGWPISGKLSGAAVPSVQNAKTYWDQVGCPSFGVINTFWYTLQDAAPDTPNPSFGILTDLHGKPAYDLSCKDIAKSSSTSAAHSSATSTVSKASGSASGSGSGSGSSSASGSGSLSATASGTAAGTAPASASASATGFSNSTMTATTMSTATATGNDSGSGSGSGTGSGASGGSGSGSNTSSGSSSSPTPSTVPHSSGSQLNSLGAAAVALILALAVL